MKILWENFLKDAVITANSADSAYPVSNLAHQFLEKKFMSTTTSETISIDMGATKTISMLAYGFNNLNGNDYNGITQLQQSATDGIQISQSSPDGIQIEQADYADLLNSSGSLVLRIPIENGNDFNFTYFEEMACRYVVMHVSASKALYIGGVGIGNPLTFDYLQSNPQLPMVDRGKPTKTDGGQLLPDTKTLLRKWTVVVPYASVPNSVRLEILAMYKAVGQSTPVWADLWNGDTASGNITEQPMYCNIKINSTRKSSRSRAYNVGITLEECR